MSQWRPDDDVLLTDTEDEEEDILQRDYHGREAMLFVIDAALFKHTERFRDALETVKLAFIAGMLANNKDLMGVMFTNTKLSPDPYEAGFLETVSIPEHCAVFLPLLQLTKPIVEHYLRFIANVCEEFGTQYGYVEEGGSFAATMRLSIDLFEFCGYSLNNANLIYITDKETPHAPKSHAFNMALQRARDLEGKEIEFHIIPMVDEFNYDIFYKEFLTLVRDVELDSFVAPDAKQLREMLASRKWKQDFLKRCLGHFRFQLGADLTISAQYYNYFKRRFFPRKVLMLRKDNSIVVPKTAIMVRQLEADSNGENAEREIKANEGWYEINLGDMPIRITIQQMLRVRNLHAPGMMLLGFKPRSELPKNLYYIPSNFMYPDDQSIRGSKRLFRALWECCIARDKIAICLFNRKRKSIPRYVALVPVRAADKSDLSFRSLILGDGFKIVYLPMAKHIRNIDLQEWCPVQNKQSDAATTIFEQIIKKLRIRYAPSVLNDPALDRIQSKLLALSLNITIDNGAITDMPDPGMQDARIEKFASQLNEQFEDDVVAAKKRAHSSDNAEDNNNRVKMAKITDDVIESYDRVLELIEKQTLHGCTVVQLRYILKEHFAVTMPKNATKIMLINRINELNVGI